MKRPYYLFSSGRLKRQHNTLALEKTAGERLPDDAPEDEGLPSSHPDGGRTPFPIESVDSLFLFGEIDINSKLITFLGQQGVPAFFFDYYGNYSATLYPRENLLSGRLRVQQAKHYLSPKKRLTLARTFVEAALFNIERVIKYYQPRLVGEAQQETQVTLQALVRDRDALPLTTDIFTLMAVEGRIRDRYYKLWPHFLGKEVASKFPMNKRERRPPSNELNALISFGNSLCYSTVVRQIYRTALDPTIAFLHEPGDRRFSLSLDIAEIFKPLLVDRAIFRLLKTGEINSKHFEKHLEGCYLSDAGRKIFVQHWDERLSKTVHHRTLDKKVSYERLIRLECYKLVRHLSDPAGNTYQGLHMWW
ncbi:CRISPR-associated protein Cas1 [Dyadobacter jejuensis]|uniref:CRISPR-associated endonuclease Cas1 n=1 Tax=Dyadobacter jejuensis TaxID=1082580 RepID=A0A316AF15_9BACT|nr:type I-B CRISPR-associated endonuclease Cas1b [Dyadobacter jejuensis]PWJ55959.1 CRISPR-associated protein Cas1 [Dyadobacter jejuensis]